MHVIAKSFVTITSKKSLEINRALFNDKFKPIIIVVRSSFFHSFSKMRKSVGHELGDLMILITHRSQFEAFQAYTFRIYVALRITVLLLHHLFFYLKENHLFLLLSSTQKNTNNHREMLNKITMYAHTCSNFNLRCTPFSLYCLLLELPASFSVPYLFLGSILR